MFLGFLDGSKGKSQNPKIPQIPILLGSKEKSGWDNFQKKIKNRD